MFEPVLLRGHNPSPMTGDGNNTYLIAGDGGAVLIDAGAGQPQHLADLTAALTASGTRLSEVLVTHGHTDHAGGAAAIADAHPGARFRKHPWPEHDERFPVAWEWLRQGDVVQAGGTALRVLHTPGHTPDHLAFWHEPSGTIFTGDLVVAGSSVMIHSSQGGDLGAYMRSLHRLLALSPERLLPAHGPAIDNARETLTWYLEHRREREAQVIAALRAGHATVEAIAESIYHGLDSELMSAARENVRAHLEKLKSEGMASEAQQRWRL